jgi:predicted acetyltransferase
VTTTNPFVVRPLTESDVAATVDLDNSAFGYQTPEDYFADVIRPRWELDRFIGAFDPALDGEQIGSAAAYSMTMTFPGGRPHPVAGVTWVGVRPGQHRRGALTAMMRYQLDDLHDAGREPVAVLTASEAAIYGRFGYGLAVLRSRLEPPGGAAFRSGVTVQPVRQVPRERALPQVKQLYERNLGTVAGLLARPDVVWDNLYSDHDLHRNGATSLMFGLHPDGYVAYRVKDDWGDRGPNATLTVHEISAATGVAWASLWRHVLDYPLVRHVIYRRAWPDDPLLSLAADVRSLLVSVTDHVWLRLVDLDRAVGLRAYRAACSVVVELTDAFCPWNAGTWRLDLTTDGGTARRVDSAPHLRLDTADLAAAFLGGQALGRLASAGRVTGDPAAIESLAIAMSTPTAPWVPEGF